MSIYSNVTEQGLDNLRKLAEQQKNQRALEYKNNFLNETHDIKLAESLSPITKRIDEVKVSTEKLGDVIKESQPKRPQLIIENNPTQQAIENIPPEPASENNESMIYDATIENTLHKMMDNIGFFKTNYDPQRGWMINNYPFKISKGTNIRINENKYNISQGLQNVFTDQTYDTAKSMTDNEKLVFRDILKKTGYYNRNLTKGRLSGRLSGRDRYIKFDLDNDVSRILNLNLDTKIKGRGVEKIIIPSNIIDIYTGHEVLLGLKLAGHTHTLSEATNLIDELYKRGGIQTKQQYRNALDKFTTQ